jgi:hypothetical protein
MVVLFIFQENFSAPFSPCYTRLSYTESHENAETVSRVKEPMGNYCDIRVRIGHHLPLEPLAESRTLALSRTGEWTRSGRSLVSAAVLGSAHTLGWALPTDAPPPSMF